MHAHASAHVQMVLQDLSCKSLRALTMLRRLPAIAVSVGPRVGAGGSACRGGGCEQRAQDGGDGNQLLRRPQGVHQAQGHCRGLRCRWQGEPNLRADSYMTAAQLVDFQSI